MGFLITVSAMPDGWVWACKYIVTYYFSGNVIVFDFRLIIDVLLDLYTHRLE